MGALGAARVVLTRPLLLHRLSLHHPFFPPLPPPPPFQPSNLPRLLPRFCNHLCRPRSSGPEPTGISASSFIGQRGQWYSSFPPAAAMGKEEITAMQMIEYARSLKGDAEAFSNTFLSLPSEAASGAAVLAKAEVFHVQGNLLLAKELYEKAIHLAKLGVETLGQVLAAISAVPEQVHIGALAGLGQLLTILGSYDEAEDKLTEALKQTEHIHGKDNFQVGVILSCIGDLYWQRGRTAGSGNAILTEGFYRSALDLLKAPPLDQEDTGKFMELNDIVTLTRARLGVNLAPLSSRRSEAVRLKNWAGVAWKNSQSLPELVLLTELLSEKETEKFETTIPVMANNVEENKHTLIDVRLGRVLL